MFIFLNYSCNNEDLIVLVKWYAIFKAYFNMATKKATFLNEKIDVQKRATKRAIFTE